MRPLMLPRTQHSIQLPYPQAALPPGHCSILSTPPTPPPWNITKGSKNHKDKDELRPTYESSPQVRRMGGQVCIRRGCAHVVKVTSCSWNVTHTLNLASIHHYKPNTCLSSVSLLRHSKYKASRGKHRGHQRITQQTKGRTKSMVISHDANVWCISRSYLKSLSCVFLWLHDLKSLIRWEVSCLTVISLAGSSVPELEPGQVRSLKILESDYLELWLTLKILSQRHWRRDSACCNGYWMCWQEGQYLYCWFVSEIGDPNLSVMVPIQLRILAEFCLLAASVGRNPIARQQMQSACAVVLIWNIEVQWQSSGSICILANLISVQKLLWNLSQTEILLILTFPLSSLSDSRLRLSVMCSERDWSIKNHWKWR